MCSNVEYTGIRYILIYNIPRTRTTITIIKTETVEIMKTFRVIGPPGQIISQGRVSCQDVESKSARHTYTPCGDHYFSYLVAVELDIESIVRHV